MIPIIEYKDQIESIIMLHGLDFKYSYEPEIGALPLEVYFKDLFVEPSLLDGPTRRMCHLYTIGHDRSKVTINFSNPLASIYYEDPIVAAVSLCHLAVYGPCKYCTIETLTKLRAYKDRVYKN